MRTLRSTDTASPYLLLTLAPLFWSCNWIVGRALSDDVPPLAMTFYRWFFALVILAPFALPRVRKDAPLIRRHWKALLGLGVVGIGTHNALAYLGLRYTTAMNGVIRAELHCGRVRRVTRPCAVVALDQPRIELKRGHHPEMVPSALPAQPEEEPRGATH